MNGSAKLRWNHDHHRPNEISCLRLWFQWYFR
ncbi:hypothetical protein HTG_18655 [Natrinema mahii]|nr:hypothetical protein HTG_18655 [Natrinema mahii]